MFLSCVTGIAWETFLSATQFLFTLNPIRIRRQLTIILKRSVEQSFFFMKPFEKIQGGLKIATRLWIDVNTARVGEIVLFYWRLSGKIITGEMNSTWSTVHPGDLIVRKIYSNLKFENSSQHCHKFIYWNLISWSFFFVTPSVQKS